jgi:hypothetical protein
LPAHIIASFDAVDEAGLVTSDVNAKIAAASGCATSVPQKWHFSW